MDEPWFRRFGGFGYRPITWQGAVVIGAQITICLPLGLVSLRYVDSNPVLGWGAAVAAFIIYFALYAVVIWTAEMDYKS